MRTSGEPADLLLTHAHVLTMDPQRRVLPDGAIAIRDGQITAVGPHREVVRAVRAAAERDVRGALVHPGFVDAHVHTTYQLCRGILPDHFDEQTIWDAFEIPFLCSITPEEEYLATLLACMEMALNGTTLFADTGGSFDIAATLEAVERVGIRGICGEAMEDGGPDGKPMGIARLFDTTENCLARLERQLRRYGPQVSCRAGCAVGLIGMGSASDDLLIGAKALADRYGTILNMHQSWGIEEVEAALTRWGVRPVEHLAQIGVLGPNTTLVHMIHVDDREAQIVAETGACVVHCPGASVTHAKGVSQVGRMPQMLRAGVPVALGSDASNYANALDIGQMAYLAATIHREAHQELPCISAQDALEMATLHGARALGVADRLGSIEVGKRADLVIHTLDAPESHPMLDPVRNLVYSMRSQTVDTVLVDGQPVVESGRLVRVDQEEALARVDAAALALAQRIGHPLAPGWPVVR
jgi:5-methylthioadenosine/S-adenosylhomocysteine deaminase